MARYKCSKCGVEANSKCVHCRSVFTDNRHALLTHLIKYDVKHDEDVSTVELSFRRYTHEATDSQMLLQVFDLIRSMTDEEVSVYCCTTHDWELLPDECNLGCHHKETPK